MNSFEILWRADVFDIESVNVRSGAYPRKEISRLRTVTICLAPSYTASSTASCTFQDKIARSIW